MTGLTSAIRAFPWPTHRRLMAWTCAGGLLVGMTSRTWVPSAGEPLRHARDLEHTGVLLLGGDGPRL